MVVVEDSSSSSTRRRRVDATRLQVPSGDDGVDTTDIASKQPPASRQRRRKRRRRKTDEDDLPFWKLVLQVALVVFFMCVVLGYLYRRVYPSDPNVVEGLTGEDLGYDDVMGDDANTESEILGDGDAQQGAEGDNSLLSSSNQEGNTRTDYTDKDEAQLAILAKHQKHDDETQHEKQPNMSSQAPEVVVVTATTPPPIPPLPNFTLSSASVWDAYGILQQQEEKDILHTKSVHEKNNTFWEIAQGLREEFSERYGTENAARMLLDKGLTTFGEGSSITTSVPSDIHATACRFQASQTNQRPFRMAFGGYTVTVGMGNKHQQSYPFQLQRLLEPALQSVGIPSLHVINAAVGGSSAFPYGWCMTNFWDKAPDVVSWDYSMNEAGGLPEGLEAYIRHLIRSFPGVAPKLIVKDTYLAAPRRDVIGHYLPWLYDPVVLHAGPAIKPFLERSEAHNPPGFQDWRKFGAPIGAPGQALHHPALREHELMGWMLAMHFLTALEYWQATVTKEHPLTCVKDDEPNTKPLQPPVTGNNNTIYDNVLFGAPHATNSREWMLNPMHCRTSFQPVVFGDLTEIVVSGTTAEDLDVSLPKSQMYYNHGWTYDLSEDNRQMKHKLSLYEDSLGFVDSREAYYGIFESPAMKLLLPLETPNNSTASAIPKVGDAVSDWFESIIVCQVSEKREPAACNMGSDVSFTVGGTNTTFRMMKDTGTLYLGKPICAKLVIPASATLTSHNQLASSAEEQLKVDEVGLLVTINVTNPHIAHVNQACSVSHVVWSQKRKTIVSAQETLETAKD